jgi:hypothetical protein
MSFRVSLAALVALTVPVSAMTIVSACGSTTDNNPDAAPDATAMDNAAPDVAPDVAPEAEAGCSNDANLTQLIPDGGLDVDAGGFALGACLSCFESQCTTQINACNADCACRASVLGAVQCGIMTGDFQTCVENAALSGDTQVTDLFGCALMHCESTCLGDGGVPTDASPTDAADGG